jgi:hypothetical protein
MNLLEDDHGQAGCPRRLAAIAQDESQMGFR